MQSCETEFLRIFKYGRYLDLLELSDAELRTEDGCTFDVHRVILARSSDYFRRMFCGMSKKRRKFRIPGITGECLSDILCYIYTGNLRVTERNLGDLLIGANYLLLEDIIMQIKCKFEAYMTEINCLKILHAAHQIDNKDIFQRCFRFIQTRFERIMRCHLDDLVYLPLDILRSILIDRSLCVCNETTVWQAIVEWTQKNFPLRMSYVPKLLLTLAMEDVGEELATEIVHHEIISKNCFMKDLAEIESSNDFTTNRKVLLTFLRSYSNHSMEINCHRLPLQLFLILSDSNNLYITYDENTDLCRKITEVSCEPEFMIAIGHNIYMFKLSERIFIKFDLSEMNWVRTECFRSDYFDDKIDIDVIVATDAYIYVLGKITEEGDLDQDDIKGYDIEVYDIANNSWFYGVPLRNLCFATAVAIEKRVYVVGYIVRFEEIVMQVFDEDTQQWSILPPPTVKHSCFDLVVYHQKIYLIGFYDAEVFDPATNLWKKMPDVPYTGRRVFPEAMVFNDQILVAYSTYGFDVCWKDTEECWESVLQTDTLQDLQSQLFCTVNDDETIRKITKQNREPETQIKFSKFNGKI